MMMMMMMMMMNDRTCECMCPSVGSENYWACKMTVVVIVGRVCTVISTVSSPQYIELPKTENELQEAAEKLYFLNVLVRLMEHIFFL